VLKLEQCLLNSSSSSDHIHQEKSGEVFQYGDIFLFFYAVRCAPCSFQL